MKNSCLLMFIFLLTSCAGVKYAEAPVNTPLPREFATRSVYPTDLAGARRFEDLTGAVVVLKDGNDPILVSLIRPSNFTTSVVPITDPNTYYKSRVQKGAEAQGSYLQFAADFSADQMAELELVDAAWAGIPFNTEAPFNEVLAKAEAWVSSHPKTDPTTKRIWIKEVVLTRRFFDTYSKIKANASGVVGPTVGVQTGVYHDNETQTKSVLIGLVAYDIDQLVSQARSIESLAGKSDEVLKFSSFPSTFIKGSLVNNIE